MEALVLTCELCDDEFASYERDLQGWCEGSIGRMKLSGADVNGSLSDGEYLTRKYPAGP